MTGQPRRSLWWHPDYLKLWTAATISGFGNEITQLGLPFIAILTLEVSAFEVALLGTFQFLPYILFTLPAGAWVDRLPRRPILIIGDLGRAAVLASIPVAFLLGVLTIWQVYAVAFLVGVLSVFFDVADQSYLPALVERERLVEANSKLEISRSVTTIGGPGLAGFLIAALTAPIAIAADVLSFLGSAVFIFLIRRKEPPVEVHVDEKTGRPPSMRSEIAAGLRYVLGHRYLRSIAACTGLSNLFSNMFFAVVLVWAVREVGLSEAVLGIVFSVGNIGVLVGALLAERIPRWLGVGRTIVISASVQAPGLLIVAIAPHDLVLPALIVSGALGWLSAVVYNVNQVSLRQAITPDRMLGRMNATMRFIVWGTIPIGTLIGGALGTWIGLRETLLVAAVGSVVAFLPVLFSPVRSLQQIPQGDPELPGGEPPPEAALPIAPPVPGAPRPAAIDADEAPAPGR